MKNLFVILIMTFALTITVFAGSVDVDLLKCTDAMVFLGRLDDFTITHKEKNYPDTECSITITPTRIIKGEAVINKAQKFDNVSFGKITPKKDNVYFWGYLSGKLYVWELENYDNLFQWEIGNYTEESIVLKERHNSSIAGGIQKFLDDGSFTLAEEQRQNLSIQNSSASVINDATNTQSLIKHSIAVILMIFILTVMGYRIKYRKS